MRGRSFRRASSSDDDDADSDGHSPERRLGITWESAIADFERTFRVRITLPRNSRAGRLARNKYFVMFFVVTVLLLLVLASSAISQFFHILSARHGVSHRSKISQAARHPPPPGSMPLPRSRSAVQLQGQKQNSTQASNPPNSKTIYIRKKGRMVKHKVRLQRKKLDQAGAMEPRPAREWPVLEDLSYAERTLSDFDQCVTDMLEWKNADEFEYAVTKRVAKILRRARSFQDTEEVKVEMGTFLDIGSFDGTKRSVTNVMELCAGWRGTCVEPNPDLGADLWRWRPSCKIIPAAINYRKATNNKCSYLHVLAPGFQHLSALAEVVEDKALLIQELEHAKYSTEEFRKATQVPCLTMDELHTPDPNDDDKNEDRDRIPRPTMVTRDPFNRVVYDLVSIHTAGGEEDILRSIDWENFVAHVIVVHNPRLDESINSLLKGRGYSRRFKWSSEGKVHTLLFEVYVFERYVEIYQNKEFWERDEFAT